MAKKEKPSVDKIVKKVNKEFEKTSTQIESLISDALKQFDTLQGQIQEPIRKLIGDIDHLREREMKRFSEELERRLGEFHEIQNSVLERIGVASKDVKKEAEKSAKPASAKSKNTAKKTEKKAAAAPKKAAAKADKAAAKARKATAKAASSASSVSSAAKPTAAEKAPAKTKPAAPKAATAKPATRSAPRPVNKSDLTLVKGVGPATAKKMQEAGITSIDQIANPTEAEKEKLKAFSSMKGFETWPAEAKKLT